jgi:hypothetical protein
MAAKANSVKSTQGGNKNSNKGKNKSNKNPDAENQAENAVEEAPVKLKENSLAAKANMVRDFNNKNTRK